MNFKLKVITSLFLITTCIISACTDTSGSKSSPPPVKPPPVTPDPNDNKEFEYSVSSNDCPLIALNPFERDWQTVLGQQIDSGDAACVKKAIEMGADVNKIIPPFGSGDGILPIFLALEDNNLSQAKTRFKDFAIVKILVEAGARLSVKNDDGLSPLFLTLKSRDLATHYPLVPGYLIYCGKASLEEIDSTGMNPLMVAITQNYVTLAQQIIFKGANINAKTNLGITALQFAIQSKNEEIFDLLISKQADPAVQDNDKNTLLHIAIKNKSSSISLKLIPLIPSLDIQNTDKETPLYIATKVELVEVVSALLTNNANADLPSKDKTPLHLALEKKNQQLSQILVEKIKNQNAKDKDGKPLIYTSLINGNIDVTQKLIAKNAELSFIDENGNTLLHLTIQNKMHEIITLLIEKNSTIDSLNSENLTPLYYAVDNNDLESFNLLVAKGANIDLAFKGETLLLFALSNKSHPDITNYLIAHSKNINSLNKEGANALLIAIENANNDQITKLLERGADTNIQDKHFHSPISVAVDKNNVELVKLLISKGAKLNYHTQNGQNLIHLADSALMIEALQKAGVPIDEMDSSNETPLSRSVANGNLEVVRYLVAQGANTKWLSRKKETLLHIAVINAQGSILDFLLTIPLDVNAKDQNGETALFHVFSVNIIDQLIRAKADVNSINNKGQSVLASFINNFDPSYYSKSILLIEKLLQAGANPNVKNTNGIYLLHEVVSLKPRDENDPTSKALRNSYDASSLLEKFLQSPNLLLEQMDLNEETVLHKVDTPEEAELLIKSGINLNPVNKNKNQTPLQKKQSEMNDLLNLKVKTQEEIKENKRLLEEAEKNRDYKSIRRLEELISNQEYELTIIDSELITLKILIKVLIDHGAK